MKYHAQQMMIDARLIYSQWKTGKAYNLILFAEVLFYFERKYRFIASPQIGIRDNIHSKMKLLYSLSGQDED